MYDWFLKGCICVIQSLLDLVHFADIGTIGSQASIRFEVGWGNGRSQIQVQGEHETTPRLAKREALAGGVSHIDSVFTPLSSPCSPPQARTCVGQLQSLYAANLKETKSILGLNDESIRSDL